MLNYKELCKKIDTIPEDLKKYIEEVDIGKEKKLFLLRCDCPNLRPEIKIHYDRRIEEGYNAKITAKLIEDKEFRNLLFTNIQYFYEEGITEKTQLFDKDEYCLFIKKFVLVEPSKTQDRQDAEFKIELEYSDDSIFRHSELLSKKIFDNVKFLNKDFIRENQFGPKVILPFRTLLSIFGLKKDEHFITDNKTYLIMKDDFLKSEDGKHLQNFFVNWMFHSFFEEYCNHLLERDFGKKPIKKPIIFVNPFFNKKDKLVEGYVELDGSIIPNDNGVIISEAKNSYNLTHDYFMILFGKSKLIESVYSINVKCVLVSTGDRYSILKDIESYPKIKECMTIRDRNDYKNGFKLKD